MPFAHSVCGSLPIICAIALVTLVASFAAQAAPAPWYWWASKLDGQQVCRQTSPGSGWERASGPFRNPRCTA